jgi:hypothetical protein
MLSRRCCTALLAAAAASCAGNGDGFGQQRRLYFVDLHGFF